jgi:hypothetical protein
MKFKWGQFIKKSLLRLCLLFMGSIKMRKRDANYFLEFSMWNALGR